MNQGKRAISIRILKTIKDVSEWVEEAHSQGLTVGFVPTMGALHSGHASLISAAGEDCDRVLVSVFVNPTQFNDAADFSGYPSTPDADLALVMEHGGAAVFMPDVQEMYGQTTQVNRVDYGRLTAGWEAADRPGHFDGVVAIVDRLFHAVRPDAAFFGEKDLQQLAVVKTLARRSHPNLRIVGCPLIRDVDGLALSSRNVRLSIEARDAALILPQTLFFIREAIAAGGDPLLVLDESRRNLDENPMIELAYLDLVHGEDFSAWTPGKSGPFYAIVTAKVGGVRLLDNLQVVP